MRYTHDDAEEPLLEGLDLVIERGERVALLGPNGTGKSTIMRLATGELSPRGARSGLATTLRSPTRTSSWPASTTPRPSLREAMDATGFDAPEARDLLGAFLFSGEDVFKKVGSLSGGERNRLSLAEIVVSGANLLLLDEPTNNLDIPAREALEDALLEYRGTMFFISHDRYFLRKLATRVVDLEGRKLRNYLGGYDYYRSHHRLDEGPKKHQGPPAHQAGSEQRAGRPRHPPRRRGGRDRRDRAPRGPPRKGAGHLRALLRRQTLPRHRHRTPPAETCSRRLIRRLGSATRRGGRNRDLKASGSLKPDSLHPETLIRTEET